MAYTVGGNAGYTSLGGKNNDCSACSSPVVSTGIGDSWTNDHFCPASQFFYGN